MNKTEIIHVRVSEGTKNALSALAEKEGCTMSAVIESLIEQAAEKSRNVRSEACERIRKSCIARLEEIEENTVPAKDWDEAYGMYRSKDLYQSRLKLCDIFDNLTDNEVKRLSEIPAYETNCVSVKDIKQKYGLSWSDIDFLRKLSW